MAKESATFKEVWRVRWFFVCFFYLVSEEDKWSWLRLVIAIF
jgi:hypothetical protein